MKYSAGIISATLLLLAFSIFTDAQAQKWSRYLLVNPYGDWCTAIAIEQDTVWVCTIYEGLIKMNLNLTALDTFTTKDSLVDNCIWAIAIDKNGNKWLGTDVGVSMFNVMKFKTYNTTNGLAQNNVCGIAIDKLNNNWFATSGGISKFNGSTWTTYNTSNGLVHNTVSCVAIDSNGPCWFGTDPPGGAGMSRFDGTNWTTYTTANGLPDNAISSIACDNHGNKWIGTFYGGVTKFNDTEWTPYNIATGLNNYAKHIEIDALGNKWFANSDSGVIKLSGLNSIIAYRATPDGLLSDFCTSVAIDRFGNKWFGSRGGVSKLEENTVSLKGQSRPRTNRLSLNQVISIQNSWPTLHFYLPHDGKMKLSIYSFNGTFIRILYNGIHKEGDHIIKWDGRQQNGVLVGGGYYIARLETFNETETGGIFMIK